MGLVLKVLPGERLNMSVGGVQIQVTPTGDWLLHIDAPRSVAIWRDSLGEWDPEKRKWN